LQILQIYRSIALCPGPSSRYEKIPLFTRATSNFHGKEWFGNISIKMESDNELERTSYGQLRLLFKCNLNDGNSNISKELCDLCLVRMYEEIEIHERIRCQVLKWGEGNHESYAVIEIDRILKAVHVVPYFQNEGQYFVNVYKF
jgi:hypothetical protein